MAIPFSWQGKRVVVTGAAGLIGRPCIAALAANGAVVTAVTRHKGEKNTAGITWLMGDIRDPAFAAAVVGNADIVLHLASHRKNAAYHREHRDEVKAENIILAEGLIQGLKRSGKTPSIVVFSSANVFPDMPMTLPVSPEIADGYVAGKLNADILWMQAAAAQKFPLLIIRPVSVYGPGDRFAEDGNVIPALIVRAAEAPDQLDVWGTGEEERRFLYVDDIVQVALRLTKAGASGVQYVYPPELIRLRVLAETIRDIVHPGLNLVFHPERGNNMTFPSFPPEHPSLHAQQWTTLEQGLSRTVDAWRSGL